MAYNYNPDPTIISQQDQVMVHQPEFRALLDKPWWEQVADQRPAWESPLNGEGLLDPKYQMDLSGYNKDLQDKLDAIQLDKRGLEAFRGEALRTGPSAWQNLMLQKQALEEQTGADRASKQAASQAAMGQAQLASRGGLMGGSAERLAKMSGRDALMAKQEIMRQGMGARADIATKDEEKRMQALSMLPGMEVASLQPELQKTQMWNTGQAQQQQAQQWNLQQALAAQQAKNQAELEAYKEKMAGASAERQATATENSGK